MRAKYSALPAAAASFIWLTGPCAYAEAYRVGAIVIDDPALSPEAAIGGVSVLSMTIINHGEGDRLISASSAVAGRVVLDAPSLSGAAGSGVDVPAHRSVRVWARGVLAQLEGLRRPLRVGDAVLVRLTFERAGSIDIPVLVRAEGGDNLRGRANH